MWDAWHWPVQGPRPSVETFIRNEACCVREFFTASPYQRTSRTTTHRCGRTCARQRTLSLMWSPKQRLFVCACLPFSYTRFRKHCAACTQGKYMNFGNTYGCEIYVCKSQKCFEMPLAEIVQGLPEMTVLGIFWAEDGLEARDPCWYSESQFARASVGVTLHPVEVALQLTDLYLLYARIE